ncbi:MAG: methyltransferase domain-containing protein [bacterium]|nr:methyltransferase domain-containing protein [bacterium]
MIKKIKKYIPSNIKEAGKKTLAKLKHQKIMAEQEKAGIRKLNIGSSTDKRPGFLNIDIDESAKPDIVRDIERGLPFDDNSVDEIFCSHTLEHIQDLLFVLREFYRVLKNGAKLTIVVPLMDPSDMTHVRFFNKHTFRTMTGEEYWSSPYYFVGKYKELSRSTKQLSTCEELTVEFEIIK